MGGVVTQCEGEGGIWREGWTTAHKGVYNQVRLFNLWVKEPLLRTNYAANQNIKSRVTLNVSRALAMWFPSEICIDKSVVAFPYCETTEST